MDELRYYRGHSRVTDPGTERRSVSDLPPDAAGMAEVIGGVIVHRDETVRGSACAAPARRDEANTRVEAILHRLGT
jgi:hypothetical protein